MFSSEPVSFAVATAPLTSLFGDRLTLWRDGNRVQWSCEGQSVVLELQPDGSLDATFVDCPTLDLASGGYVSAVYRRRGGVGYRMTAEGSTRMVDDMTAFFSGTREASFTFVDAQAAASTF